MATTTAKALAFSRELIDLWTKEVSTSFASIAQTFEVSTGNPIITLSDGSPAFSEKVVVVRIRPIPWTATDILGLASQVYTPHVIDICTETNGAGDPNILTTVELLPVIGECVKRGTLVNWYQSANGVVPAIGQIIDANLKASFGDLYWSAQKAQ